MSAGGRNIDALHGFDSLASIEEVIVRNPSYVVIASPATCHIEAAMLLVKNKIPILVEKPLSQSYQDCLELQKVCHKSKFDKLSVGYCLRFMPSQS